MIEFRFEIKNPWSNRFKTIRSWSGGTPFKYKYWEIQTYKSADIISIFMSITTKKDHAGLNTSIGFFGYNLEINLYDTRHWDSKRNKWHVY